MLYNLLTGAAIIFVVGGVLTQIDEASSFDPYGVYRGLWGAPIVLAFFGWSLHPTLYWVAGGFLVVALLSTPFMIVKWFKLAPARRKDQLEARLDQIVKTTVNVENNSAVWPKGSKVYPRKLAQLDSEAVAIQAKLDRVRAAEFAAETAKRQQAERAQQEQARREAQRRDQRQAEAAVRARILVKARETKKQDQVLDGHTAPAYNNRFPKWELATLGVIFAVVLVIGGIGLLAH
jgi:hypothetical protein